MSTALMTCPGCGSRAVVADMRANASVPVGGIERGAVEVFIDFGAREWEVEDVYCEECDWSARREDFYDYEWLADYPPDSGDREGSE